MIRVLFIVAALLMFYSQATGQQQCVFPPPDNTNPKSLTGDFSTAEYSFKWATDVDDERNGVKTYYRVLKNFHSVNLLPAKWEKAQISFQEIKPGQCGYNNFQSKRPPIEEPRAEIAYGSKLEHKLNASLYTPTDVKGVEPSEALQSSIQVNHISVTFTSSFKDKTIRYMLKNEGKGSVDVKLATLPHDLEKLIHRKEAVVTKGQPKDFLPSPTNGTEVVLTLVPSSARFLEIEWRLSPDVLDIDEKLYRLEVWEPSSLQEPACSGLISAQLPKRKQ